jgi:hypothetical protein
VAAQIKPLAMRGGLSNHERNEPEAAPQTAQPQLGAQSGFSSRRIPAGHSSGGAGLVLVVDEQPAALRTVLRKKTLSAFRFCGHV